MLLGDPIKEDVMDGTCTPSKNREMGKAYQNFTQPARMEIIILET
jgi:hypothetical protein